MEKFFSAVKHGVSLFSYENLITKYRNEVITCISLLENKNNSSPDYFLFDVMSMVEFLYLQNESGPDVLTLFWL